MIAVHNELKFKIKVTRLNKDKFTGTVIESDSIIYPVTYYGTCFDNKQYSFYEEAGENIENVINKSEINTPKHYDNSKGTLYKVAQERGWNAYLFDCVKRLERAEKKGNFKEDLEKTIAVIQLYLKEYEI
jgi:hypothetical protein